jgi:hypothetical protein
VVEFRGVLDVGEWISCASGRMQNIFMVIPTDEIVREEADGRGPAGFYPGYVLFLKGALPGHDQDGVDRQAVQRGAR